MFHVKQQTFYRFVFLKLVTLVETKNFKVSPDFVVIIIKTCKNTGYQYLSKRNRLRASIVICFNVFYVLLCFTHLIIVII